MCGRFTQTLTWPQLVELYRLDEVPAPAALPPRYNVAPTQDIAVVRRAKDTDERQLVLMRWGLVPFWAKDIGVGARMINARAETVAETPAFRTAFRSRRCLIVADGFYEWQKRLAGPKQPYHITTESRSPFAFAGLWERWAPDGGQSIETCTIVTTRANEAVMPIHDRMPAMLGPADFEAWLDTRRPTGETQDLLKPWPGRMATTPVSRRVNAVANDDRACLEPAARSADQPA